MSSVSVTMLGHIPRCANSYQIWSTLLQVFAGSSKARLLQLRVQLQMMKKGSLSISDFVMKIRNIADNLAAADQIVSDDELLLYLLGGLDSDYNSIVAMLTSRPDFVSLAEAQFILQCHETRLEQQNADLTTDLHQASANLSENRNYGGRGGRGNTSNRSRARGNRRRGGRGNRPICQICNRSDHLASACWFRFDQQYQ